MNRLSNERSPYLRHAAQQKIDWYPWSDEAFARAAREDRPVFLSSGGVWCHWCHVMAKECFEDEEIAALLNDHFISVKLDRDERPDIDRRYQQANALMGNAGGWPLSIFLTPDRRPFFGGTYFPPDDRYGRPGFKKVLRSVEEFFRSKKGDAARYGERVMEALKAEPAAPGAIDRPDLDRMQAQVLDQYDPRHGGFGTSPKFPMPGAVEFLIRRAAAGNREAEAAVRRTLDGMARGGFRDHLGGGFHRYSVDEGWFVPHFEKMADDNAWLLRNYLEAYALFGDECYREVAEGIVHFVLEVLSDREGGFFASQDADVTPDDEGGYFTWTGRELADLLTIEEYEAAASAFFHDRGMLPHGEGKRVLCLARSPEEVSAQLGWSREETAAHLGRAREKMLARRRERQMPFIDRTIYTSLNGMFITSFLTAAHVLEDEHAGKFALQSLERILQTRAGGQGLLHADGVPAVLDDYVHLVEALVAAYEATGDRIHLDRARTFMDDCIARFGAPGGGFFDTDGEVLGTRLLRIEDVPHPSANAVAIVQMIKLWQISGDERYRGAAEKALRAFAPAVGAMSIHAGMYACALDAWFNMMKLTVEALPGSELHRAALRLAGPATVIVHGTDRGRIIPCLNETCYEPVTEPHALLRLAFTLPP
jgi:uncharacterized protein YyaL (SSP411 family)